MPCSSPACHSGETKADLSPSSLAARIKAGLLCFPQHCWRRAEHALRRGPVSAPSPGVDGSSPRGKLRLHEVPPGGHNLWARMHRMMKEESSYRTSSLENATRDPSKEKLHMKLCSGSCHAEQILQTLNSYRQSGIFTDVVLLIDGQEFPCHRATLSANSTYFRAMFGGNLKEGHQNIINIQKISASTMSLLLDYMYGGNIVIQEDNVEGILELSDLLQISKLRDACITFLEGQLHPCNCLGIMKFADSFSIASLTEKSKRFMLECFVEVSCHEEFLEMGVKELVEYLSDEQLVVPKEEVVFEAVMRWVRHDVPARKGALKDLLEHVRLPLLDPTYFLEKVEMDGLIQDSKECIPLLHEARKYYILGNEVSSLRSRPRR
uniref:BTB domain-containing protein n=2 Tax=Anas TaxID=8835 RepID=U3IWA8_ANAPP